ncbi:hypothetical protein Tco_0301570, partial [Tanacetum coccineum]
MLSASKLPLFFWAEAIAIACYTQNRSFMIPRQEKTPYHINNGRKPSIKHLHIFGCTCYITRYGEKLDKMKEKGICAFWWDILQRQKDRESTTREPDINFDGIKELSETSVDNNTSGLVPQRQKVSDYDNSGPVPQLQKTSDHNR